VSLPADLTRPATLKGRLPEALDLLYYIATPGAYDDEAYRLAYVEGLKNLISALDQAGERPRLVFVSSTAVYGQTAGEWVDEDSPTEPAGFSGRRMLEAEAAALNAPLTSSVIRFGGIYGPGRTRMLHRVREGAPCVDQPPRYTNRIHEADCIGVLDHVGTLATPQPRYLAVDNEPCPQCTLMDWLADQLGLPRPSRSSAEGAPARAGNKRCDNSRLRSSGYEFLYPSFRDGYAGMLADQNTRGPTRR
jgi:nucleoside-diphosphate-sugar epimerase